MPFHSCELELLKNWVPGPDFDTTVDRLLLYTDWSHVLVLRNIPGDEGRVQLILDPDFLPTNMSVIPSELKMIHDFHIQDDWWVCLYDGEMTSSGPKIDLQAIGSGWSWNIRTSLGITKIEPIALDEIDHGKISTILDGIYIYAFDAKIHDRDYDRRHDRVKV